MAEYITREAVFEQFDNGDADVIETYPDGSVDFGFGASNIRNLINAIPAADVAPVVHGRWRALRKYDARRTYRCSVCGRTIRLSLAIDINEYAPYCNCGAKMDGGACNQVCKYNTPDRGCVAGELGARCDLANVAGERGNGEAG